MHMRHVVTVLGGTGFLGRYIIQRLVAQKHVIRVGCRSPSKVNNLRPLGRVGQIVPLYTDVKQVETIVRAVEGAEIVINLAASFVDSSKNGLSAVNEIGAGQVAKIAAAAGVEQLIHMSVVGCCSKDFSKYHASKSLGESQVKAYFSHATIVRTSILTGAEDKFLTMFGRLAKFIPLLTPSFATNIQLQPVYVGDVADAVVQVISDKRSRGRIYELGGPQRYMVGDIQKWVLGVLGRQKIILAEPMSLARMQASFLECMPASIFSPVMLVMLAQDSLVSDDYCGFTDLELIPVDFTNIAIPWLIPYRSSGK